MFIFIPLKPPYGGLSQNGVKKETKNTHYTLLLERNRLLLAGLSSNTILVALISFSAGQVVFAGETLVGQELDIHLQSNKKTKTNQLVPRQQQEE